MFNLSDDFLSNVYILEQLQACNPTGHDLVIVSIDRIVNTKYM